MVLVANAVVLHLRARLPDDTPPRVATRRPVAAHAWIILVSVCATLVLGTIVTGAGPHAGDEDVQRYGFSIPAAVRTHSIAVWFSVALVVLLAWRVRNTPAVRARVERPLTAWAGVAVAQGAVGYIQYFSDVPAPLVFVHVAGATALWAVTVWLVVAASSQTPAASGSVEEALHERGALVDHR
jgi:cytochrome c oxidase assembly protein subunit 15